jgi:hypothetical protein
MRSFLPIPLSGMLLEEPVRSRTLLNCEPTLSLPCVPAPQLRKIAAVGRIEAPPARPVVLAEEPFRPMPILYRIRRKLNGPAFPAARFRGFAQAKLAIECPPLAGDIAPSRPTAIRHRPELQLPPVA